MIKLEFTFKLSYNVDAPINVYKIQFLTEMRLEPQIFGFLASALSITLSIIFLIKYKYKKNVN